MSDGSTTLHDAGVTAWLDHPAGTDPSLVAAHLPYVEGVYLRLAAAPRTPADDGSGDPAARLADAGREVVDLLRSGRDGADGPLSGLVSVDVDPRQAHDASSLVDAAESLCDRADRPAVIPAVPATPAGCAAITTLVGRGRSVNATLVLSADRYLRVAAAVIAGLERAAAYDLDLTAPTVLITTPVSPVETEVDKRLWAIGTNASAALRGRAALANARLVHAAHRRAWEGGRWTTLAEAGARTPTPVWCATEVRDPYYLDTRYVEELVTDGVVTCMTERTLTAFVTDGAIQGDTVREAHADATAAMADLAAVGVDYAEVAAALEAQLLGRSVMAWEAMAGAVSSTG